jgi:hypothetical protein
MFGTTLWVLAYWFADSRKELQEIKQTGWMIDEISQFAKLFEELFHYVI